jgi:peptide/nickel transport system substrate-binding protein
VNRQSRALLAILILAAILVPYWLLSRPPSDPVEPGGIRRTTKIEKPSAPPTRGGSIVATTRSDPRSFNRLTHPEIATELFALMTQGRLVRINRATQEVEPWLAEKWAVSSNGRTYTLSLRRGVTWSDGTPFTADDVLFTLRALYDPRVASPLVAALTIAGKPITAEASDTHTVAISYAEPFGPGIRLLDLLPIMPKHKLEAALAAGTFGTAWTPNAPLSELVAIGPFRLTEYQPAQRMVFERNPGYWRRDERGVQLPYADRLTIEIFPDQDTEIVRLQAGQSDFMQQALRPPDIETLRPLEAQGRVQIVELGVSLDADSFVFNLRPEKWKDDPRAPWMMRREFRQALSHAVDREAFANTVFLGAAVPVHGPITPGNARWFWPSIPRYEFSRDKARALLTGLGLSNRDQDEWLEDAGGREARLTVLTFRSNSELMRGAEVLRDDLRQIGVALDVVALETNTVRQRVVGGDFEAAFIQFQASDPDPAMSKDLWVSSGGAHFWNPGQKTPATEWEKQIDDLMARQASTIDEGERKRLFNEVQRLFAEHLPMLHFAAQRSYVGASARLVNLSPALTRPPLLWSADTLGLKAGATAQ